jgi:hypothetical protein
MQHTGTQGEKLGHETGEPMGFRVLADEGQGMAVEVSERAEGKLLGESSTNIRTYRFTMKPDGSMEGRGQGIMMLKDGSMSTWTATGTGRPRGASLGAADWNVEITLRNATGKLAQYSNRRLSGQYSVDENWKSKGELFDAK